ncbi:hypothetical protein wVul_1680 [Wolbachia endosymbiont of Armadillidium vulgare str. wVulC]|nr:hypothetical protein wVul_1680 [Wolbachia endosymbiont of Armadillidium vulgare str. wVulC]
MFLQKNIGKKVSAAIVPIEDEVIPKSITKRTNKKHYKLV